MGEPSLTVIDAHDPEAVAAIGGGLQRFNEAQTGIRDSRPLTVVFMTKSFDERSA